MTTTNHRIGQVNYELSNHLGNVLAVITDRKIELGTSNIYSADVVSYSDYSPYGTMLPHRHGQASGIDYRYGFQGQEADDELKGEGNSYNYTYRMHDPRIGRFFAVDPLAPKYPELTPYQFSSNRPIDCVELEGLEAASYQNQRGGTEVFDYKQKGEGFTDEYMNTTIELDGSSWESSETDHWKFQNFVEGPLEQNLDAGGGFHYLTDDPWDPNYGVQYDQYGFALQESYAMQTIEAERFHNKLVANANALDNIVIGYFSAPFIAVGVAGVSVAVAPAVGGAVTFMGGSSTVVGTGGMLTTATNTSLIFGTGGAIGSTYLYSSLTRSAMDATGQALVNGPENIDVNDAFWTGFAPPGVSAVMSGAVDNKPFANSNSLKVVGVNKSVNSAFIDATFKYTFSSAGPVGKYPSSLTNQMNQFAPSLTPVVHIPFSTGGKYATKKTKEAIGL